MRKIQIIIIAVLLYSCVENDKSKLELDKYIENPSPDDVTCLQGIERAKKDVASGKLVFTSRLGFGTEFLRQEKYLEKLCETYNLVFEYELFSCIRIKGQRQGCYGAYMDKMIEEKYGKGFKQLLLAKADSMLAASNDTIPSHLCDKSPQIPGENENKSSLQVHVPEEIRRVLKTDDEGKYPFMDIGFYIDKSGNVSGFSMCNFNDAQSAENQQLKDELYAIGVKQIQSIPNWKGGIISGQVVNTLNNVRVYFQ